MTTLPPNMPHLSDDTWRQVFTAFGGPIDTPKPSDETPTASPKRTLLAALIADEALDELPPDHPTVTRMLAPFFALSEDESAAVLAVNNAVWETGEAVWRRSPGTVSEEA